MYMGNTVWHIRAEICNAAMSEIISKISVFYEPIIFCKEKMQGWHLKGVRDTNLVIDSVNNFRGQGFACLHFFCRLFHCRLALGTRVRQTAEWCHPNTQTIKLGKNKKSVSQKHLLAFLLQIFIEFVSIFVRGGGLNICGYGWDQSQAVAVCGAREQVLFMCQWYLKPPIKNETMLWLQTGIVLHFLSHWE